MSFRKRHFIVESFREEEGRGPAEPEGSPGVGDRRAFLRVKEALVDGRGLWSELLGPVSSVQVPLPFFAFSGWFSGKGFFFVGKEIKKWQTSSPLRCLQFVASNWDWDADRPKEDSVSDF